MRTGILFIAVAMLGGIATFAQSSSDPSASDLPKDRPVGTLEEVARLDGPIVTGIAVSHEGRIFVSFPRWTDPVEYTVAELVNGQPVPYPNLEINDQNLPPSDRLISVQSVVIDARNRLWLLDSGSINQGQIIPGGPKLIGIDLATGQIFQKIVFGEPAVRPFSYLNDVRFDLTRGEAGYAFISDSSAKEGGAIITVDLASYTPNRRLSGHITVQPEPDFLPVVEGQPLMERPPSEAPRHFLTAVDGIALSADGSRLFYSPLSSRYLYSVSVDALLDRSQWDEAVANTIIYHGDKGTGADGLETDSLNRLYITAYEHDAILRRNSDGNFETVAHDPRLLWPDSFAISQDGYLYVTVNQLHRMPRFHEGKDLREKPWVIFRTKIDAGPSAR